jgi:O-acetyl-ADP-ribose deacetylase (regulator of RNase III)
VNTESTLPADGSSGLFDGLSDAEATGVLARYELLGEAGRGGMGVVYHARHRLLGRSVALKVCRPGVPLDRFEREARLLAGLRSPHLVAVHDFERLPGGRALLALEWVPGGDLSRVVRAAGGMPLPEDRVLPWMRQVCDGMAAAASQGVIHRDLKPSNVLVGEDEIARVGDFGLARSASERDLTHSGGVLGSPYYMAPEQAEDPRSVDSRADLYSFGATFYHALTGRVPFDGPSTFSVLFKHKTEPLVAPAEIAPGLSARTAEVLERCLAKSPAGRFPSFQALAEQLRPVAAPESPWAAADDAELAGYLRHFAVRAPGYLADAAGPDAELDAYRFPRGQVLRICRGDITRQRVDALVSSDHCWLAMRYGVSLALRMAGGEEVFRQAAELAPVRAGRAVVTTAGRLPARFVFHACVTWFGDARDVLPSRDIIAEAVGSCLYHAETLNVETIAFPLLGTGALRFPRDVCLEATFRTLARALLRGLTPVRDARIVLFDPEKG